MAAERERPWQRVPGRRLRVAGHADDGTTVNSAHQRSQGCRLLAALCRGHATPAMIFEFAAEMERRGERGAALDVEQIGNRHLDLLRRRDADRLAREESDPPAAST